MENYGFCFANNSNDSYHLYLNPEGGISNEGLEFRIKKDLLNTHLIYQSKLLLKQENHMSKNVLEFYHALMMAVKNNLEKESTLKQDLL